MRHHILTTVRRVAVLAGLAFTAACSSDATAPTLRGTPEASAAVGAATVNTTTESTIKTAGRLGTLRKSITVTAHIGAEGGTIRIPQTGFELVVPPGAVAGATAFRVTALAGSVVAYEFAPHGIRFKAPLKFRQSVLYTNIGWGQAVGGGYFTDPARIDPRGRKAQVAEQIPARIDGSWVVFDIWHFSGYLVSCA